MKVQKIICSCGAEFRPKNPWNKHCSMKCRPPKQTPEQRKAAVAKRVSERRRELKRMAVAHLGGSCEKCGYNRCINALEFHHRDPGEKDFGVAMNGNIASWDRIKTEIEKCMLLCANCHREEHARLNFVDVEQAR